MGKSTFSSIRNRLPGRHHVNNSSKQHNLEQRPSKSSKLVQFLIRRPLREPIVPTEAGSTIHHAEAASGGYGFLSLPRSGRTFFSGMSSEASIAPSSFPSDPATLVNSSAASVSSSNVTLDDYYFWSTSPSDATDADTAGEEPGQDHDAFPEEQVEKSSRVGSTTPRCEGEPSESGDCNNNIIAAIDELREQVAAMITKYNGIKEECRGANQELTAVTEKLKLTEATNEQLRRLTEKLHKELRNAKEKVEDKKSAYQPVRSNRPPATTCIKSRAIRRSRHKEFEKILKLKATLRSSIDHERSLISKVKKLEREAQTDITTIERLRAEDNSNRAYVDSVSRETTSMLNNDDEPGLSEYYTDAYNIRMLHKENVALREKLNQAEDKHDDIEDSKQELEERLENELSIQAEARQYITELSARNRDLHPAVADKTHELAEKIEEMRAKNQELAENSETYATITLEGPTTNIDAGIQRQYDFMNGLFIAINKLLPVTGLTSEQVYHANLIGRIQALLYFEKNTQPTIDALQAELDEAWANMEEYGRESEIGRQVVQDQQADIDNKTGQLNRCHEYQQWQAEHSANLTEDIRTLDSELEQRTTAYSFVVGRLEAQERVHATYSRLLQHERNQNFIHEMLQQNRAFEHREIQSQKALSDMQKQVDATNGRMQEWQAVAQEYMNRTHVLTGMNAQADREVKEAGRCKFCPQGAGLISDEDADATIGEVDDFVLHTKKRLRQAGFEGPV